MNTYTGLAALSPEAKGGPEDRRSAIAPGAAGKGERRIMFSAPYPGGIEYIPLAAKDELIAARGSFLASSPNVSVTGKLNFRGVFDAGQDQGSVLPKLKCSSEPGCVWLSGYSSIRRHDLKSGEKLLVNNGRFLAAKLERLERTTSSRDSREKPLYTVVRLGKTMMSTMLGGEGLGMQFSGPCVVYTQSHDFEDLVRHITSRLPVRKMRGGAKQDRKR